MKTKWYILAVIVVAAVFMASTVSAEVFNWHGSGSSTHHTSSPGGDWERDDNWTTDSEFDFPNGVGHVARKTGDEGNTTFFFDTLTEITLGQFLWEGRTTNFDNAVLETIIWDNDGAVNAYGTHGALFERTGRGDTFRVGGSSIRPNPTFQLDDDLTIRLGVDHINGNWSWLNGAITGDGMLTVVAWGRNGFISIGGDNTYSGGTVLIGDGDEMPIELDSSTALGTGDSVRIQGDAVVSFNASDILVAGSTLYIDDDTVNLTFNQDQSLGFYLNIDGVYQDKGVYNASDFSWGGSGTLNVIPEPGTIGLAMLGVVAFLLRRRFVKVS